MGIGSKLKRFVRKVIPNEAAELAVKAAPFVAPFNPAIAAAMAGIGSFDQTGRIGSSVKAGLGTYVGGQGARMLGGAGFQKGFGGGSGIGSYFTSPFTGNTMFGADKGSFFQGNNSIFGQGTPGAPQIIDSPLTTADPTAAYNASGQTGNVLVDGYTAPTTDLSLPGRAGSTGTLSMPSTGMPDLSLTSGSSQAFQNTITNTANQEIAKTGGTSLTESLKEMFNAKGFGEKLKIAEQFAKDHPLTMSLLGGSVTAVMQYLENEANEDATKNDFRTFAEMGDDTYNLQYVADGGPIVKEEKQLTAREGILGPTANGGRPLFDPEKMSEKYAQGGRIGFQMGGGLFGGDVNYMQRDSMMADSPQYQAWENIYSQNPDQAAMFPEHLAFKQLYETENKADGGRIGFKFGGGAFSDEVKQIDLDREMNYLLRVGQARGPRGSEKLKKQATDNIQSNALDLFYDNLKNGGLAGYFNGGRVDLALGGGPNREPNMEMDLRPGGFIPVGIAERADDVPARVSKNEFVMTADAVRAAGGGSVDKGAQVMYDLMNRLEGQA